MAVYRLYKGGSDTYQGWNGTNSTPYTNQAIATIQDPNGAVSNKEITSIPSPFARIDLVKSAFVEINQACNGKSDSALRQELDKSSIYHKMVSDSLDIGEIFFNIDKFKGKIEIISWNPKNLINQTGNAKTYGQRCYANSLDTYWKADGATYNFDKANNIYILNYIGGPKPLNIIGATSPATLFFSNANDLSYIKDIQFAQDKPFDNVFQPLYKRDPEYIKYLWWLSCSIGNFSQLFPDVYTYLQNTYQAILDDNLKNSLLQIQKQNTAVPTGLTNIIATSNNVEVLNFPLYQKVLKQVENSDFTIKSTKQPNSKVLVLPVESGNKYLNWLYTTGTWGENNCAPYFDKTPILQRRLPHDNSPQPYLTISDFLEETILASPHKLNNNLFYDGNFCDDDISYLLPLKPLFFEYFSVDDIINDKLIELSSVSGGSICVTIKIPTIKGNVVYSRMYSYTEPDINKNEGKIVDAEELEESEITMMPAVAMPVGVQPYYTFSALTPFGRKISLEFYQDGKLVDVKSNPQERNKSNKDLYKIVNYTLDKEFECIQVKVSGGVSMAIPMLQLVPGNSKISFAVDLGTSNTHIEYIINGNMQKCQSLEYSNNDKLIGNMFLSQTSEIAGKLIESGLEQVKRILSQDILPEQLNSKNEYHFPTRTALSYSKNISWDVDTNPFEMCNICFPFAKEAPLDYNDYETNIKWSDNSDAQKQISYYIKSILLTLRNKVLTLGGDLASTKLTWFYPTSMSRYRLGMFQNLWNLEYHSFFGENAQINYVSESLAPVAYHQQSNSTAKDILTIDIGGGTTDMAFASNDVVNCITSFRFAANALFEDSFSKINASNGIIDYFKNQYYDIANEIPELKLILQSVDNNPTNMANTLFTIMDVPCVRKKNLSKASADFIMKLRNESNFKLEIIIFYASILYHAGKIIAVKGLSLPRHIAFSGNGSNILKVLATPDNHGKRQLAEFSKMIIELSTGLSYSNNKLDILGFGENESPKSSTCKGGLLQNDQDDKFENIEEVVLLSSLNKIRTNETYKEVDNIFVENVVKETYSFFDVLKQIHKKYNFADNFGVSENSWNILDDILSSKADIETFVYNGIKARKEKEDADISETFFFYPIASILQQYSISMFNYLKEEE